MITFADMAQGLFYCPLRIRCSYRIATIIVCSCNVLAALYLLQSLLSSLFLYPSSPSSPLGVVIQTRRSPLSAVKYTEEQLNRMKEAVAVWKAAKPVELIKRVKEIQQESTGRAYRYKQVDVTKGRGASGIAQRLKELRDSSSKNEQEALEEWRKKKLEEAKKRAETAKAKQDEYLGLLET